MSTLASSTLEKDFASEFHFFLFFSSPMSSTSWCLDTLIGFFKIIMVFLTTCQFCKQKTIHKTYQTLKVLMYAKQLIHDQNCHVELKDRAILFYFSPRMGFQNDNPPTLARTTSYTLHKGIKYIQIPKLTKTVNTHDNNVISNKEKCRYILLDANPAHSSSVKLMYHKVINDSLFGCIL